MNEQGHENIGNWNSCSNLFSQAHAVPMDCVCTPSCLFHLVEDASFMV